MVVVALAVLDVVLVTVTGIIAVSDGLKNRGNEDEITIGSAIVIVASDDPKLWSLNDTAINLICPLNWGISISKLALPEASVFFHATPVGHDLKSLSRHGIYSFCHIHITITTRAAVPIS